MREAGLGIEAEKDHACNDKDLRDHRAPDVDDRVALADVLGLHGGHQDEIERRVGEDRDLRELHVVRTLGKIASDRRIRSGHGT